MEQDLIAELRLLLREIVTPELDALMAKLDEIQQQTRLSERNILEVLASFRTKSETLRAEMAASHAELLAKLETLHAQMDERTEKDISAENKANRFVM